MSLLQHHELYPRLRCECCGYPTRWIGVGRYGEMEYWSAQSGCLLCDWDNASVGDSGVPLEDAPSAEERNGGYTLEQARENFRRHSWMYNPAVLEPWMLEPATSSVLELRRALQKAYNDLLRDFNSYELWQRVLDLEHALRESTTDNEGDFDER